VPDTAISASAASAAGGTLSESPSSLAGADERLDRLSGVWIKRGRRLVQQQYLGLDRKGSGQAEQLLLTAGKPERRVLEPVADGIPETDLGQPVPRDFPEPVPTGQPVSTGPGDHVVHDGHRERVGPLEEHADLAPQGHQLDARVPDAPPVQQHVAGVPVAGHLVVHPVECPQQGGLARASRPEQRGHHAMLDFQRDVAQHRARAEAERQVDRPQRGAAVRLPPAAGPG
jgi:hypothetical protein